MSVQTEDLSKPRWERDLHSAETLSDDLGVLGSWVGPRTGPFKRTKGQKEDYVLRRLVVAWKILGRLRWPVRVHAQMDDEGRPDFLFLWLDGETLGVEITEASGEDYQPRLTESETVTGDSSAKAMFKVSTPDTVNDIKNAIARKIRSYDHGAYREPDACDLVLYDNTASGGFLDKQDLIRKLDRPNDLLGRFRQIHLISGETVVLDLFGDLKSVNLSDSYEIDYAAWIFDQVERMRRGASADLDLQHIAEELEDLGRSERRALRSHLRNLLSHLLKWQHQPDRRGASWSATIDNSRADLHDLLTESPSLRGDLQAALAGEYRRARSSASRETDVPAERLPERCPYSEEQLLDPDFYPDGQG